MNKIKCDIVFYMENVSNIKRETVNGLKNINYAGLFARFVAFIVDLAIASMLFFGGLIFNQNVICNNLNSVKEARSVYTKYQLESGLILLGEDNKTLTPPTYATYDGYLNCYLSYYQDFLTSDKIPASDRVSYSEDNTVNYWFNVHILGLSDTKGIYTDLDKLDVLIKEKGPELFAYKVDASNNPLVDQIALPKCQNNDPTSVIDEENQKALTKYFYISDAENVNNESCVYHVVLMDLAKRPFLNAAFSQFYLHFYTIPIISNLILSATVFFFIIPLIAKNGETLGKRMFHLCLANKLGYRYRRIQLIPRFLFPLVVVAVLYFILGINIYFLGAVTLFALASYCLSIFTKKHTSIHDYIAGTIVVDKTHSEIFLDAVEEDKFRHRVEGVESIVSEEETPRPETVLYQNENYGKNSNKEG